MEDGWDVLTSGLGIQAFPILPLEARFFHSLDLTLTRP